MKAAFEKYVYLLEREAKLSEKTKDHLLIIQEFYADDIVQQENDHPLIKGKAVLLDLEIKNLETVLSIRTTISNQLIDEITGLVWGEMLLEFDSKKSGPKKIEEAFMQQWKAGKICYQKFYYKET